MKTCVGTKLQSSEILGKILKFMKYMCCKSYIGILNKLGIRSKLHEFQFPSLGTKLELIKSLGAKWYFCLKCEMGLIECKNHRIDD